MSTLKLYRHALSGHAHRAELFLSILGLDYELVDVDLMAGEQKQAEFLQKNRFGQVPVLEDGDVTLADSNAILTYLAIKYDQSRTWLPTAAAAAGEVERYISVASGPVENGPATARLILLFKADLDHAKAMQTAHSVFKILNEHLNDRDWLVGQAPTIADIANYSYIAHAPEGGISLDSYPNIQAWLERVEALPGFVPMVNSPVGLRDVA